MHGTHDNICLILGTHCTLVLLTASLVLHMLYSKHDSVLTMTPPVPGPTSPTRADFTRVSTIGVLLIHGVMVYINTGSTTEAQ